MAFLPPINLGSFKPAPATLAQWVYDIWQYLQENPIATQDDIVTYIQNYFETSPEVQEVVGEIVAQYLLDNPPQAPVQSVLGMTGAVQFDSRNIDVDSSQGDTTIAEKFAELDDVSSSTWTENGITFTARKVGHVCMIIAQAGTTPGALANNAVLTNIPSGFRTAAIAYTSDINDYHYSFTINGNINVSVPAGIPSGAYVRFSCVYITA